MPRLKIDDLEFCARENRCLDCHLNGEDTAAVKFQRRGKHDVPFCRKHYNEYKRKISQADARKYKQTSAQKQNARQCAVKGYKNKLIPQELLPPWITERTCGQDVRFKPSRANRASILRLIVEHCLTPEEREGIAVQNIIYRPGEGLVWFSFRKGRATSTIGFAARSLLELHKKYH